VRHQSKQHNQPSSPKNGISSNVTALQNIVQRHYQGDKALGAK
jgi:hypothetical protein